MPLLKLKPATDKAAPSDTLATVPATPPAEVLAKAAPAKRHIESAMTKDDYWRRREERDLIKDKHIRLSGVLQAVLGSVNFGQYCTVADKNAYLADVEEAALRLAKFVTEKAV